MIIGKRLENFRNNARYGEIYNVMMLCEKIAELDEKYYQLDFFSSSYDSESKRIENHINKLQNRIKECFNKY